MNISDRMSTFDVPLDVAHVKADFPIFGQRVYGKRLVFLDSAASSQKPLQVLDAMDHVYRTSYASGRPASACSTGNPTCSTPCRRS